MAARMNRWSVVVATLYVAILAALSVPMLAAAFAPEIELSVKTAGELFVEWQYWLILAMMFLSQYALLRLPVRVTSRRPVTRGAIWPALLAGGLMFGCLAAGAAASIVEFVTAQLNGPGALIALGLGVLSWIVWVVVFARSSRSMGSEDLISRQSSALAKGSILELLIAVPTHIVARHRDYCCAGFMTFVGLTAGVSVMLFAFGPAIFFLFAERWKRLQPAGAGEQ